jgi:putative membrane protein
MKRVYRLKNRLLTGSLFVAICAVSLSFSRYAEIVTAPDAPASPGVSPKDQKFLNSAAEINLEEIQLGQLAQQAGKKAEVKDLGQMMERDHKTTLNELIELAKNKSVTIPTQPNEKAEEAYRKLSDKAELNFDRDYCDMMIKGHQDAISLFREESTATGDEDIRKWVLATIPHLQKHLEHSMACRNKVK